jgi:hypothetical protein
MLYAWMAVLVEAAHREMWRTIKQVPPQWQIGESLEHSSAISLPDARYKAMAEILPDARVA